jgi:acetylornithine deacetylase/succinyl-diaminopimelate desuccinylase-like protein
VISKYGSSEAFAFGMGRDFSLPGGAHQPNEYTECDKLVEFTKTIAAYILNTLG